MGGLPGGAAPPPRRDAGPAGWRRRPEARCRLLPSLFGKALARGEAGSPRGGARQAQKSLLILRAAFFDLFPNDLSLRPAGPPGGFLEPLRKLLRKAHSNCITHNPPS